MSMYPQNCVGEIAPSSLYGRASIAGVISRAVDRNVFHISPGFRDVIDRRFMLKLLPQLFLFRCVQTEHRYLLISYELLHNFNSK